MSSYENYSQTAVTYDRTRGPIGVEIITGCLAQSATPLGQQRLLDAGCGTGNYSRAMIEHVGRIAAVDLNTGMLAQARAKFSEHEQRIDFSHSNIEHLPFESAVYDGLMINQVMHHLDDQADARYPRIQGLLNEFARVLKPGGTLVINICSQQQLAHGFWYGSLIPEEVVRMRERHVPLEVLKDLLEECGFEYGGRIVPVDALLQGQDYFNPLGPFDPTWRSGDSIWSTVSPARIDDICSRLAHMQGEEKLQDFVRKHDAARSDIGQITFMYAGRR